jgi:hypothetical protein
MSNERVKPLFEDASASPELRNFVAMARSDGPSQAELDHLARRLAPVLGVSAGLAVASQAAAFGSPPSGVLTSLGSAAGSAAGSAGSSVAPAAAVAKVGLFGQLVASTSAKLVAVGLGVGVAGVGAWELQRVEPRTPGPQVPAAQVSVVESPQPMAAREVLAQPVAEAPSVEPEALAAAPIAAPALRPAAPAGVVASRPVLAHARQVALPAAAAGRPAAIATGLAVADPVAAQPVQPLPSEAPLPPAPSELTLIRRAQAARGDVAGALSLLAQHEQLYPHGALAQEREVLAIELLLKAGRTPEAQLRARRFELAHTGSAHLPHLRALLQRAGAQ